MASGAVAATDQTARDEPPGSVGIGPLAERMLRQAAEPMVGCDAAGTLVLVNDAAKRLARVDLEGKSLAEAGALWGDLYERGQRVAPQDLPLTCALRGETQVGREVQLVRRDGIVQTLLIGASPVLEDGAIVGAIANVSEITGFRKSEERFRALVESVPIGVIRSDIHGRILDANDAFLGLVGYSREDLQAGLLQWRALTPPEFLPRDEAAIAEAMATGRCSPYEKAYVRKDGVIVPILIGYTMVGPKREEAIAFVLDRTERKAAGDALRASEQRLRGLLDNLFAFVGILDLDGVLRWVNRAPLEAAGLTLDDVRGKPFEEAYWWSYDPLVQAKIASAAKRAAQGQPSRFDVDVRMVGGHMMTIDFMIAPLRNAEGVITHLIPSAVDITERNATEEALRESEARLHLAQDAGGIGVWDWDVAADAATWSDSFCRLVGLEPTPGPKSVTVFLPIVHPDDLERVRGDIESGLASGTYRSEYRVILPSGEVRWLAAQGETISDTDDRPVRMIGVAYDITARHDLLEHKEFMLHEVNHRVKNSLQLVSSLLNLQQSTLESAEMRSHLIEADRRILAIAKIHEHLYRGVGPANRIEFAGYLRDLCAELEDTVAGGRDIRIVVEAQPLELPTDQVISLALIVNELVTNAAKYAFEKRAAGRIAVSFAAGPEGLYRLVVGDDGCGLPDGFKVEESAGLGMKVAVGLVRGMGARLEVGAPDKGASFVITLAGRAETGA